MMGGGGGSGGSFSDVDFFVHGAKIKTHDAEYLSGPQKEPKKKKYTFEPNELIAILEGKKPDTPSIVEDNLLILKGNDKKQYLDALKHLGYDTDLIRSVKNIKIDKKGFSQEVAKKLGEDYLVDKLVIVNEKQSELDLKENKFSFMPILLNKFYDGNKKLIETIAPIEALVTDINIIVELSYYGPANNSRTISESNYLEKLTKGKNWLNFRGKGVGIDQETRTNLNLFLETETPTSAIKRMGNIKKKVDNLTDEHILGEKEIHKILKEILPINKKYGNIKEIKDLINARQYETNSFKFKSSDIQLYVIGYKNKSRVEEPFVVYFGEKIGSNLENIIYGNDKEEVYDFLLNRGYLKWDKEIGISLMDEIEADIMRGLGYTRVKNFDEVRDKGLKKLNELDYFILLQDPKAIRKLGRGWFELRDVIYNEDDFSRLSFDIKLVGTHLNTSNKYVAEVYAKINPEDLLLNYIFNEDNFPQLFEKTGIERKKTVLTKILTLKNEQLNPVNSKWLLDNYRDLLGEVKLYEKIVTAVDNYSGPEVMNMSDEENKPGYYENLNESIVKSLDSFPSYKRGRLYDHKKSSYYQHRKGSSHGKGKYLHGI